MAAAATFLALQGSCDGISKIAMEHTGDGLAAMMTLALTVRISAAELAKALDDFNRAQPFVGASRGYSSTGSPMAPSRSCEVPAMPLPVRRPSGDLPHGEPSNQRSMSKPSPRDALLTPSMTGMVDARDLRGVGALSPANAVGFPAEDDQVDDLPPAGTKSGANELFALSSLGVARAAMVAWSPDGAKLATGRPDRDTRVWQGVGNPSKNLWSAMSTIRTQQSGIITSFAWSPDGNRLLMGGVDGIARIWRPASEHRALRWETVGTLSGHKGMITAVDWSRDGEMVATSSVDGNARVWILGQPASKQPPALSHNGGTVLDVAFAHDSARLITGCADRMVRVWQAPPPEKAGLLPEQAVHNSIDGNGDNNIDLPELTRGWQANVGRPASSKTRREHLAWECVAVLDGHFGSVTVVAACDTHFATASRDDTVRVWRVANGGYEVFAKMAFDHRVDAVCFSPDGNSIVTGCSDKKARIWQPEGTQWRHIATLGPHLDGVTSVSWSPDGMRIACGGADASTTVWHRKFATLWEQVELRLASVPKRPLSGRR